jgi:hypothetical protein
MANKITKFDLVEAIQTQTKYEKKIVQTII